MVDWKFAVEIVKYTSMEEEQVLAGEIKVVIIFIIMGVQVVLLLDLKFEVEIVKYKFMLEEAVLVNEIKVRIVVMIIMGVGDQVFFFLLDLKFRVEFVE